MITFKAFVPSNQRKGDGTYNVKIRCTFKRKTRWIPTNLYVTDSDLTRGKNIKNPYVAARCETLVRELRDIAGRLSPLAAEKMDVDDVMAFIRKENEGLKFKLDFFDYCEQYAASQTESSGKVTRTAANAFRRFIGGPVDINSITTSMVRQFVEFLESEPKVNARRKAAPKKDAPAIQKKPGVSSWKYVSVLRNVFKKARYTYNDEDDGVILIPRTPFDGVKIKEGKHVGQRNLGPEVIQRLISADPKKKNIRFAIDVFVLSFGLMGVNLADMYAAPPVDEVWIYERKKTANRRKDNARMEVPVPYQLRPYLERLKDITGERWLRLFREGKDASAVGQKVNRALKRWAKEEGIKPFTLYASRHSWASIARSADVGIDKATVEDCLDHATMKLGDIYMEKDYRVFANVNKKVLALFRFPGVEGGWGVANT